MKKKYIWLIEIVIWLIVILCAFFFFIYNTAVKENVSNSYYLFFNDAGGLVKGSPVRLMGINIGYVRDVKIFDNKVFVSFLVTKDGVIIPNRASATVEFYGLGGSTSLELNPQTSSESANREVILPVEAYRIQDFWDGQELVANVMIDIYGGIGRTIQAADLINHKHWLKQSGLVKDFSHQADCINTAQSVIIYKLSESTNDYLRLKEQAEPEVLPQNDISEEINGVEDNE